MGFIDKTCKDLISDAYKDYSKLWIERETLPTGGSRLKSSYEEREKWGKVVSVWRGDHGNGMMTWEDQPLSQEEFINKIKTDDEFSEKWGLKIEERELSLEERIRMYALKEGQTYGEFATHWNTDEQWLEDLSDTTIPTKLITITYNDKTIESYE